MKWSRLALLLFVVLAWFALPQIAASQQDSSADSWEGVPVYKPGDGIKPPRATYQPSPEYDDKDRKKKVTGTVILSLVVTREGRTADIKVVQSLTDGLDRQAIKAVSVWTFDPASKDGKPVAVRIRVETTFNLR